MELILHVGQSKTGTTALQSALKRNRKKLAQRGILYPDVYLKGMALDVINHNPFVNALNDVFFHPRLKADEYWQQFKEQFESGDYHTMLLSAESFFGGSPYPWELENKEEYFGFYAHKLERMKAFAKNFDITIIGYLRPQVKWLESAIPHLIRYQGTTGKDIYQSDEQMLELLSTRMQYDRLVELWIEIIKPKAIKLKEYNRNKFPNGDVLEDFFTQIDINDPEIIKSDEKDNTHDSWSREFIEVKKKLSETKRSRIEEDTIIDLINHLEKKCGSGKKYSISPEIFQKVLEKFQSSNQNLADQCNGGNDLFSELKIPVKEDSASQEEIDRAMKIFQKSYSSWLGQRKMIYHTVKVLLKRNSPFLYAFCARQWHKIKC